MKGLSQGQRTRGGVKERDGPGLVAGSRAGKGDMSEGQLSP